MRSVVVCCLLASAASLLSGYSVRMTAITDDLAPFIGIPANSLIGEHTHLNRAEYHAAAMKKLDFDFLQDRVHRHCAPLMEEFFPGYSLRDRSGVNLKTANLGVDNPYSLISLVV